MDGGHKKLSAAMLSSPVLFIVLDPLESFQAVRFQFIPILVFFLLLFPFDNYSCDVADNWNASL